MLRTAAVASRNAAFAPGTALARHHGVKAPQPLAVAAVLALCGCASLRHAEEKVLAANPAPAAGFVEADKLEPQSDSMPFDRVWLSPERDWTRYPKLYVAVVDVSHLLEMSWWDKLNIRKSKVEYDLVVVADELREDLIEAFRDDPRHHFELVENPEDVDADTAQLEVAIVELVPNKAVLGAIGLAAWGAPLEIGIPVATATAFIAHGSVAMEACVRDGRTGEVIATFADRETGKMRVIDLRSLTWYGNALEDFRGWAQGFAALANQESGARVRHAPYFTFSPW